uniref:PID domain-containing protein n=1 Tax=Macrostomum lignano TaxID=282301 RepID=A0A1I8IXB3_9PLAT
MTAECGKPEHGSELNRRLCNGLRLKPESKLGHRIGKVPASTGQASSGELSGQRGEQLPDLQLLPATARRMGSDTKTILATTTGMLPFRYDSAGSTRSGDQPSRPGASTSAAGERPSSSHHRCQSPPPDSAPSSSTRAASPEASSSSAAAAASVAESPESLQFSARYLGWRRCIRAVSAAPGSPTDAGVLDSYLQLDWKLLTYCPGQSLARTSPRPQPLLSIRLWGASGQNFAYVSREQVGGPGSNRAFVCHVFHCQPDSSAAANLANALCHRCKLLMMMMSARRPLSLALFPTPQAEPQKCVPCQYLGSCLMDQHRLNANSSSIDIDQLNSAIDSIVLLKSAESAVLMASPSTISIVINDCLPARVEFRVRFLRFMGVSRRSVQLAGLVFQNAAGCSECHLCRLPATCAIKCLDSRTAAARTEAATADEATATEGHNRRSFVMPSFVSMFTSIWRRNSKAESKLATPNWQVPSEHTGQASSGELSEQRGEQLPDPPANCPATAAGWERHRRRYWRLLLRMLPSGTIQRDPPALGDQPSRPRSFLLSGGGAQPELHHHLRPRAHQPLPQPSVAESPESLQFSARYLGWRRVDNSDIVCSNRSSRAVNHRTASAAANLANALCHRCKLLMMMMSASNSSASPASSPEPGSVNSNSTSSGRRRPLSLALFPTPQAEPQKCVPCQYLGSCLMDQHRLNANSSSIDIDQLNSAIDSIVLLKSRRVCCIDGLAIDYQHRD